ncbi:apolipoprotein N-acyltransferase [Aquincola tertiaricarbonis]|uniref:apolipoprotein N-acyltransferase n=1 Tax=Aquincola tertiaricarbonis TaxID=391953 RepID=UPI000A7BB43C|nr:apolipoprotein N-acyltransferase [Aquincola tertiaricarbonis]
MTAAVTGAASRSPALRGAAAVLLAATGGALFSLPFVHTGAWWASLLLLALLAGAAQRLRPGAAALAGWAFGTGWLAAGTWWLFISLHVYGGLPAALAVAAVLALSAGLSLYLGLALAVFARLRRGRVLPDAALFAACWLLAELARGVLFTGFPWIATGYAQVDGPLAGLAPWVGVYGIGAAAALAASLLASLAAGSGPAPRRLGGLVALAAALALAPLAARDWSRPTQRLAVTLIQTNVAQDEKFAADRMPEALDWLLASLRGASGDLVIAPETAIPLLPAQLGPENWQAFAAPFAGGQRAGLIGLPLGSYEAGYTNSVAGVSAATVGSTDGFYRYDKHHLVPFGEFIPTGFRWFTELMNIPLGDFNRGPLAAPSFSVRGERVAPNICYEDLFGEELAQRFGRAAEAPTIFANVSNIGWFGNTIAIEQHLHISRMRTLELQRPMLRATNTGATAVIDHRGQVLAQMAPFTRGTLAAEVEGREGLTPFVRWASRFGLWPPLVLALAVLAAAALGRRRATAP